jgi:hypothetical protein
MISALFPIEPALFDSTRARPLSQAEQGVRVRELTALALCGIAAAVAAALPDFISKVPGHAILRPVLPVLCGLALVPRRGSGTFMSLCGLGTTLALPMFTVNLGRTGFGNVTSMLALGPALDLALLYARGGWTIYLRCLGAGVAANLIAFAVRLLVGSGGGGGGGGRGSSPGDFLLRITSYVVCGAVAGLIGAVVFFRMTKRDAAQASGAA